MKNHVIRLLKKKAFYSEKKLNKFLMIKNVNHDAKMFTCFSNLSFLFFDKIKK